MARLRRTGLIAGLAIVLSSCGARSHRDDRGESATTTTAVATTTTVPPTTTAQPGPPRASRILGRGTSGPDVVAIQDALAQLHFWVGPTDGDFGLVTEQAVFAFQKVNGLPVDGKVGPAVRAALADPATLSPRSNAGLVWEVDKARQLVMVVRDGVVLWVWNTSTGTDRTYASRGRTFVADTPSGHFTVEWQVDGWREGALGPLYRPKYFHRDGIAIHGSPHVPPEPASHGCVRVTPAAMDFIWESGFARLGTDVWVYGDRVRAGSPG